MEKLSVKTTALALAIVGGILSLACAAIIALWPAGSLKFFNAIFHGIDLTLIAKANVSIGSVVLGLVEVMVIGAIAGALFAWLYNYFNGKIK
ncbi:hypothetical protein HYU07_01395 [Candidatus Woesearchaeota archaeon]|nr:hypothetical protein [Candidatus Woesearchaeota archaeon]